MTSTACTQSITSGLVESTAGTGRERIARRGRLCRDGCLRETEPCRGPGAHRGLTLTFKASKGRGLNGSDSADTSSTPSPRAFWDAVRRALIQLTFGRFK